MTVRNFNNVTTVGSLTGPVASSAITLGVQNFSNYPTAPFTITVDRNTATEEICLVTAVAGGTLTVTRGFDGSAAVAHSAGAAVEHTAGAIEYIEANAHVNATANVHGVSGGLVGTDGAQSLFAKTLVSPVVQADPVAGDAVVAWVPPAAPTRNLFRGMNTAGADVITVDAAGNVLAQNVHAQGTGQVDGVLTAAGGVTVPVGKTVAANGGITTTTVNTTGNVTVGGTVGVTGLVTASGGITVPTGKVVTVTDAPTVSTSAANKAYVDSTAAGASAATASALVRRDAAGRAQFVDPAVSADAATKNYVDTKVANLPARIATGTSSAAITAGLTTITQDLSYGVTFSTPPRVYITMTDSSVEFQWAFGAFNASTTGFRCVMRWTSTGGSPATGNLVFNWLAIGS